MAARPRALFTIIGSGVAIGAVADLAGDPPSFVTGGVAGVVVGPPSPSW